LVENKKMPYQLYILKCRDGTLYTGITTDLKRRVGEHNGPTTPKDSKGRRTEGLGSKYVAARLPAKVVYSKKFRNRSTASREEARIKSLTRSQKLILIRN
jgi:putative endonuclease